MTLLLALPWYTVDHDPARRLLRVVRTSTRLAIADIVPTFDALNVAIAAVDRPSTNALLDVRLGPANNDRAFEATIEEPVKRLYAGFRRRAILVRTLAGALQINRLARERHIREDEQRVFQDETEALAWLEAG